MNKSNIILRSVLIFSITLSLFFIWKLWTNNYQYIQATKSNNISKQNIIDKQYNNDIYLPTTTVFINSKNEDFQVCDNGSFLENFEKYEKKSYINNFTKKHLGYSNYLNLINRKNTVTMSYENNITINILKKFICLKKDLKRNIEFNRIQLSTINGNKKEIVLLNDKNRNVYIGKIHNYSPSILMKKYIYGTTTKFLVSQIWYNNSILMEYINNINLNSYTYLLSKQMQSSYLDNLFDNINTSNINAQEVGNDTVYTSGTNKRLSFSHNNGLMIFNMFSMNNKINDINHLLIYGEQSISSLANPLNNLRYFSLNKNKNIIYYRRFTNGFPIFSSANRGLVKVSFYNNSKQIMFNNDILQVSLPSNDDKLVVLPPTLYILNNLKYFGINIQNIQNIKIGYQWIGNAQNNTQIANLKPMYFIEMNNNWQSYSQIVETNKKGN